MATGGSTNLVLHLPAMARAAGVAARARGFRRDLSAIVPLMAKVYPNGLADVNHFHAAGGLAYMIGELLEAGLAAPGRAHRRRRRACRAIPASRS